MLKGHEYSDVIIRSYDLNALQEFIINYIAGPCGLHDKAYKWTKKDKQSYFWNTGGDNREIELCLLRKISVTETLVERWIASINDYYIRYDKGEISNGDINFGTYDYIKDYEGFVHLSKAFIRNRNA
jgi:hypothetical protein